MRERLGRGETQNRRKACKKHLKVDFSKLETKYEKQTEQVTDLRAAKQEHQQTRQYFEKLYNQYETYQGLSMKAYRDQFIAHFDLALHVESFINPESEEVKKKRLNKLPAFDIAYNSLFSLYELIKKILQCKESSFGYTFAVFNKSDIEKRLQNEINEYN